MKTFREIAEMNYGTEPNNEANKQIESEQTQSKPELYTLLEAVNYE